MNLWSRIRSWSNSLFHRSRAENEMDAELRFHVDAYAEDLVRNGIARNEALRRARIEFGGVERTKEECREARGIDFFDSLLQDLRFALRMLRKSPGFTAIAVVTLALGIGLNSTIFSILNGLFLREPPVRNPEGVVVITLASPSHGSSRIAPTPAEFSAWREKGDAFDEIAAGVRDSRVLNGAEEPERVKVERVTPNYFRVVGVSPVWGRDFAPAEDVSKQNLEVVISYELWQRQFGVDPTILGKTVVLSNLGYTVIGVMQADIKYAMGPCDVWIPEDIAALSANPQQRASHELEVVGRLKKGVPVERAQAEVAAAEERFTDANQMEAGWTTKVERLRDYRTNGNQRIFMSMLMALTAVVLLIACVNVAGIFLARCASRRGEFAIRAALGAGRWRTVRQLLAEALLLSLLGGVAASLASVWGTHVLRSGFKVGQGEAWVLSGIQVDRTVLLFTFCISLLAVLLFGLAPAIQSSKTDLNATLKESGQTASLGMPRQWMRNSAVIAQVALAMFLTVAAGTTVRMIFQQLVGPRGFEPKGILTVDMSLSGEKYSQISAQAAFFTDAFERVQRLPGVQFAGGTQELPVAVKQTMAFEVEGKPALSPAQRPSTIYYIVSPNYFRVMCIPFLRGRDFLPSDHQGAANVAIVSEAFVKRYLKGANPVGKHVRLFYTDTDSAPEAAEIVGVAGNVATNPLRQEEPEIYVPFLQRPQADMKLVLRTNGDPTRLVTAVRQTIWAIDKNQPVGDTRTMREVILQHTGGDTFLGELLAAMTLLALVLATLGIYAVVARMAVERTREIGLRMALGAQKAEIFRMVIAKGMLLTGTGLALGLLAVAPIPRYLVVGSSLNANTLLVIAPVVILGAAIAACYIPARRAMRVDPLVALRYE